MAHMIITDLITNLTLLITLSVVSVFIEQRWPKQTRKGAMLQGLLFGCAAVICMSRPVNLGFGQFLDSRSVALSLCALFFGPWAAVPAVAMAIVYRVFLGGVAVSMGVLASLVSVGAGLGAFCHLKNRQLIPTTLYLYLFSLIVHLLVAATILSMPADRILPAIKLAALPVIVFYPLATVLAGKVLASQQLARVSRARLYRTRQNIHITMQSIGDGVISTNLQGTVMLMNPAAERLTGWSRTEAQGQPLGDVYRLQVKEHAHRHTGPEAQNSDAQGGRLTDSMVLTARDGSAHYVTHNVAPIYDTGGGRLGEVIVFRDVDQEYASLEALQEREEDYRSLFEDHIAVKLIIELDSGKIVDANHAAAEFYGWSRETLCNMNIREINQLPSSLVEHGMRQADTAQKTQFEFKHRIADGSIRDVEVYSSRVRIKGGSYLHSIVHDITERKQSEEQNRKLQEQLTQVDKMESIGRLAGGVAHDFNNMLSLIIGYAELALDKIGADHPTHEQLKQILFAAHRSAALTSQLLAFARKQTVHPKVLDLNLAMAGMLNMLQRLINENIELVWRPGTNLGLVKIDPAQVDQILANLAVNARDAIAGEGRLTIETKNITLGESCSQIHSDCVPGDYVLLTVSDTGVGIGPEELPHLFEPFFTTKPCGRGTGLGLATVYGIVRQNHGFITVYSERGVGTAFRIYLPRVSAGVATTEAPVEATVSSGSETILLVEDEKSILMLAETILKRYGYTVIATDDPESALAFAQNHPGRIDLLLTDVVMPGMSGSALNAKIRQLHPQIKTIFMSGYPFSALTELTGEDDGAHYLPKPFSVRSLALKARRVLDS